MFSAFQWNCFILVYTSNIALILFLKCDVTKCRIPPPLFTQCHTLSTPSLPLNVWRNLWMVPNKYLHYIFIQINLPAILFYLVSFYTVTLDRYRKTQTPDIPGIHTCKHNHSYHTSTLCKQGGQQICVSIPSKISVIKAL